MLEQNDPDGAMIFAEPYLDADRSDVRDEAEKVIGLALFGVGEYEEAAAHFTSVAERSGNHDDWFNLATAATMAGEIIRGEDAMDRAVEAAKGTGSGVEPSIPYMRLYYAHALADVEEYERSLEQLNALRAAYRWFPTTDPAYLESRGIPPIASVMIPAMKALVGLGDGVDAAGWLREFAASLDEGGRELVAGVIAQLEAGESGDAE
jgi:tetratricopeptide (TPR) repeat protein